ncbi:DUF6491 family protein [Aliikangiella coralliicola]|uniref:Lipoprotein n=1 Tax=Aliikangiella coralliicola TaxID=2592383 RepID=A0A545UII2_9GAMM|nr:DUF6491 family protein [Aliikangiella coralliicola]TQV89272.1 hypothetical protein FLL46_03840 [Aliikangiella coralliicola]
MTTFSSKRLLYRLILLLPLIAGLSACATATMSNAEKSVAYKEYIDKNKLDELNRITAFKFYGWRYLNKEHLILSTALNKPYLITLKNSCIDLHFSNGIGVEPRGNSLNAKFDSIFPLTFPEQRCFIKSIHKISRQQADELSQIGKEKAS